VSDRESRPADGAGSGSEHARVVAEVLEDQKRRREAQAAVAQRRASARDTSFFVQVAALVSGTLFFYLLFFSPAWITPNAPPEIAAETRMAGVRLRIATVQAQIDAFREREGRLPRSLDDLEAPMARLEYVPIGGSGYQLRYEGEPPVTYTSSQDPAEFLGSAAERILEPSPGDDGEAE
jgi:hypothetical protein